MANETTVLLTRDGLKVKTIINKVSGLRIPQSDMDERLVEYAENNRDQFAFIYLDDSFEAPGGDITQEPAKQTATVVTFSATDLKKLNKSGLLDLATDMKCDVSEDNTKDEIIDAILAEQESIAINAVS